MCSKTCQEIDKKNKISKKKGSGGLKKNNDLDIRNKFILIKVSVH